MSFNIDTLIEEVTHTLNKISLGKKQTNKNSEETEKLKSELSKQEKKNQIMRQQVLELKELVANHLKDMENKLKDKDEIIEKLKQQFNTQ